jgi:hypothetical protein
MLLGSLATHACNTLGTRTIKGAPTPQTGVLMSPACQSFPWLEASMPGQSGVSLMFTQSCNGRGAVVLPAAGVDDKPRPFPISWPAPQKSRLASRMRVGEILAPANPAAPAVRFQHSRQGQPQGEARSARGPRRPCLISHWAGAPLPTLATTRGSPVQAPTSHLAGTAEALALAVAGTRQDRASQSLLHCAPPSLPTPPSPPQNRALWYPSGPTSHRK